MALMSYHFFYVNKSSIIPIVSGSKLQLKRLKTIVYTFVVYVRKRQ